MTVSVCTCLCVRVCLSASIYLKIHVRSLLNYLRVTYGCGSVLLWWRCDTLCTAKAVRRGCQQMEAQPICSLGLAINGV